MVCELYLNKVVKNKDVEERPDEASSYVRIGYTIFSTFTYLKLFIKNVEEK